MARQKYTSKKTVFYSQLWHNQKQLFFTLYIWIDFFGINLIFDWNIPDCADTAKNSKISEKYRRIGINLKLCSSIFIAIFTIGSYSPSARTQQWLLRCMCVYVYVSVKSSLSNKIGFSTGTKLFLSENFQHDSHNNQKRNFFFIIFQLNTKRPLWIYSL